MKSALQNYRSKFLVLKCFKLLILPQSQKEEEKICNVDLHLFFGGSFL